MREKFILAAKAARPPLNLADRAILVRNMNFIHALIVTTEDLLLLARSLSEGSLRYYFEKHSAEEKGHALELSRDLKALGHIPEFDLNAAEIAGLQYYLILQVNPAVLLGYMAVLECAPMDLETVDKLEKLHGPLSMIRHHAEHDVDHSADLLDQIELLSENMQEQVAQNAEWVSRKIRTALEGIANG